MMAPTAMISRSRSSSLSTSFRSYQQCKKVRRRGSSSAAAAAWMHRLSRCLWHIHKCSTLLFCWLVILNGLAGVLPSSSNAEHRKVAEELRKKVASNLTTSSEEEELTREIMALFDYDDEEERASAAVEREATLALLNGTNDEFAETSSFANDSMQFSVDSNATSLLKSILSSSDDNFGIDNSTSEPAKGSLEPIGTFNGTTTSPTITVVESSSASNLNHQTSTELELTTSFQQSQHRNEENGESTFAGADQEANSTSAQSTIHPMTQEEVLGTNGTKSDQQQKEMGNEEEETSTAVQQTLATDEAVTIDAMATGNTDSENVSSSTVQTQTTTIIRLADGLSAQQSEIVKADGNKSAPGQVEAPPQTILTTTMKTTTATTSVSTENSDNLETKRREEEGRGAAGPEASSSGLDDNLVKEEANIVEGQQQQPSDDAIIKAAISELQRHFRPKGHQSASVLAEEIDGAKLRDYREQLVNILANVETMLMPTPSSSGRWPSIPVPAVQMSDFSKSKRFIAISASLPNWESAFLLNRRKALSSPNADEIRKSPTHTIVSSSPNVPSSSSEVPSSTTDSTSTPSSTLQPASSSMPIKIDDHRPSAEPKSDSSGDSGEQYNNPKKTGFFRAEYISGKALPFNPVRNNSLDQCNSLSQAELVNELKQKGTYNPELMAWDVSGVFRFLDRSMLDQYERQTKPPKSSEQVVRRNVEALEQLLGELNLQCEVRTPEVLSRLGNLTMSQPKRSIVSPSMRAKEDVRHKRNTVLADMLVHSSSSSSFNSSLRRDSPLPSAASGGSQHVRPKGKKQKLIGDVHVVPFGCDKRGFAEDGYLRLCGACQAIRKLPDEFFPPFINEVMCDEDKACLYFYDYPHGKCRQKHMNFVVLRNVGTQLCQVWEKFNLNVRVSCECFVDEMSFFAKYV